MRMSEYLRQRIGAAYTLLVSLLLLSPAALGAQDSLEQRGFSGRVHKIVHYSSVNADLPFGSQFRINVVSIDEDTYDQNGNHIDHDFRFVGKERSYVFNEAGQLIEELFLKEEKPVFKKTYEYLPSGRVVKERYHSFDNESNYLERVGDLNYEYVLHKTTGKITEIVKRYTDGQIAEREVRSYDSAGRLTTIEQYHHVPGTKDPVIQKLSRYDVRGNLVETRQYGLFGDLRILERLEYDHNNNILGKVDYDTDGKMVRKLVFAYANGNLVERKHFNENLEIKSKDTYQYDGRGCLIRSHEYAHYYDDHQSDSVEEYVYDGQRRRIQASYRWYSGRISRYSIVEYSWPAEGEQNVGRYSYEALEKNLGGYFSVEPEFVTGTECVEELEDLFEYLGDLVEGSEEFPDGMSCRFEHDEFGRLRSVEFGDFDSEDYGVLRFSYDSVGSVTERCFESRSDETLVVVTKSVDGPSNFELQCAPDKAVTIVSDNAKRPVTICFSEHGRPTAVCSNTYGHETVQEYQSASGDLIARCRATADGNREITDLRPHVITLESFIETCCRGPICEIKETTPSGESTSYQEDTYNAQGRLIASVYSDDQHDITGKATVIYDERGNTNLEVYWKAEYHAGELFYKPSMIQAYQITYYPE